MAKGNYLGEFEQIVLLAVFRSRENAYGVRIRDEIRKRTGRSVSFGAVYTTLERLQRKGYVRSWVADPTPQRGGRAKKYFKLQASGVNALRESRRVLSNMWGDLEASLDSI